MDLNENLYAAPRAAVTEESFVKEAPALWNPNAAANWSLLFTPIFGAILHLKNWQAIGDKSKVASAWMWVIVLVVLMVGLSVMGALPHNGHIGSRPFGILLLFIWYFGSARGQVKYVEQHFGKEYPRKKWGQPFLYWLLVMVAMYFLGRMQA